MEVFGLHGSLVGSSGKSEVISHVSREEEVPSSKAVIMGFILHSVCSGSQVYSESEISSFKSKYVVCCHSRVEVTSNGSIVVSRGEFLRRISRVCKTVLSDD